MLFSKLQTLTQLQLESWISQAKIKTGKLPNYVPLLSASDPNKLAVALQLDQTQLLIAGDSDFTFSLMSVIKPFLLLFLLHWLGHEHVLHKVGVQPSTYAFNSLQQLIEDQGFPRNPMINSGAIMLADLLPGTSSDQRCECLRQWLNQYAGSQLRLNQEMLASVRSLPNQTNYAIADQLAKSGYLDSVETALDTYNQICCLAGTVMDLVRLGQLLAYPHCHLSIAHQHTVNVIMRDCGLYEAAGYYSEKIGLPIKSGVSGGLLAIFPEQGVMSCYSPQLDRVGNPVVGLSILEQMMEYLRL